MHMARKAAYKSRGPTTPQEQACQRWDKGFFFTLPQGWHNCEWRAFRGSYTLISAPARSALRFNNAMNFPGARSLTLWPYCF
jgi:hypothetical protein